MDFIKILIADMAYQEKMLRLYEERLKQMPKGHLASKKKGNAEEFYHVEEKTRKQTYINRENQDLIDELKIKHYLSAAVKRLKQNITAQEKLLKTYLPWDYASVKADIPRLYGSSTPEMIRDCSSKGITHAESKSCETHGNKKHMRRFNEEKLHLTTMGLKVRSKSEAMIAEILAARGLTFEYERPLNLMECENEIAIYPDFTFTDRRGNKIYWEHFGMLGVESYRNSTLKKLNTYISNGIIPSVNLVVTADNTDGTIDVGAIARTAEMLEKSL